MLSDLLFFSLTWIYHNQKTTLVLLVGFILIYHLVVIPYYTSPLRNVPGPYIHRISRIPALYAQLTHRWVHRVHELHQKYGDVIILSPTEISCNGDPKYITDIYVKNMPKAKFYENFRCHGFKDNIFAALENDLHLKYKKLIQSLYLKTAVYSQNNPIRRFIVEKIKNVVQDVNDTSVTGQKPDWEHARLTANSHGKGHKLGTGAWFKPDVSQGGIGMEMYSLFGALAMDVVSAFELGVQNCTKLLPNKSEREILVPHRMQAGMTFWTTLMPRFWELAAGPIVCAASERIEQWQLALYARAEDNVPEKHPSQNLSTLETLKSKGLQGKSAYSFISDNIFAGHETTAVMLTYMCYELSRPANLHRQLLLRKELREAFGTPGSLEEAIDDFEAVDQLTYLEALMQENLRVHAAIPGAEPRITDKNYTVNIKGKSVVIPPGTGISCQPFSMHRVASVFPKPDTWLPERWLPEEQETSEQFKARYQRMQRNMFAFGKGIRMCLGMQIALIDMKLALANLYWRYSLAICEDWCIPEDSGDAKIASEIAMNTYPINDGQEVNMMAMADGYTTRPNFDECWLRWTTVEEL
ncbi:hypothetical protein PUMCH_003123 [Australozyma saopauloensis]|uniref:Cytochrome P450 n=1 Tax=Australozyma saopauloensis TaxID=291208 RepID=A0AAX4HBY3_9ASCO|nr:hypothetical protein PUMCH_003123 [[Candida] saopauloensis]